MAAPVAENRERVNQRAAAAVSHGLAGSIAPGDVRFVVVSGTSALGSAIPDSCRWVHVWRLTATADIAATRGLEIPRQNLPYVQARQPTIELRNGRRRSQVSIAV
jgi:hypothetical protein